MPDWVIKRGDVVIAPWLGDDHFVVIYNGHQANGEWWWKNESHKSQHLIQLVREETPGDGYVCMFVTSAYMKRFTVVGYKPWRIPEYLNPMKDFKELMDHSRPR